MLALLLAEANETVPAERLIDGVWDEAPPETAANLVQGYVSQLRKALGKEAIATRGSGYARPSSAATTSTWTASRPPRGGRDRAAGGGSRRRRGGS